MCCGKAHITEHEAGGSRGNSAKINMGELHRVELTYVAETGVAIFHRQQGTRTDGILHRSVVAVSRSVRRASAVRGLRVMPLTHWAALSHRLRP